MDLDAAVGFLLTDMKIAFFYFCSRSKTKYYDNAWERETKGDVVELTLRVIMVMGWDGEAPCLYIGERLKSSVGSRYNTLP
jgi:hypothetical protein